MVISIQYLRGLASLMVLIEHITWKGKQYLDDPLKWFHIGGAGVDIFFIISGFIMCYTTRGKHGSIGSISSFLKKRVLRIMPLYWLLTIIALIVYILIPERINTAGGETEILSSFFLFPTQGSFLLKNGWTLSYEYYFYIIFSMGLFFQETVGRYLVSIILLSLVVIGLVFAPKGIYHAFLSNPVLIEFLMGIVLYYCFMKFKSFPRSLSLIIVLAAVAIFVFLNRIGGFFFGPRIVDYGIPAFMLCMGVVLLEKDIERHKISILQKLGDSSYSLYLLHPFVLSAFVLCLDLLHIKKSKFAAIIVCFMVLVSLFAGYLCYLFVEKKMDKRLRGLLIPKKAAIKGNGK
jgi:exopolysaccharide production protein ExoZ